MNKEEFLKECEKEGLIIYGTTWEFNLKRLKELKKYKKIVEEIEEALKPGAVLEYPEQIRLSYFDVIRYTFEKIKQKYFPKPVNKLHQLLMELDELVQETLMLLGG